MAVLRVFRAGISEAYEQFHLARTLSAVRTRFKRRKTYQALAAKALEGASLIGTDAKPARSDGSDVADDPCALRVALDGRDNGRSSDMRFEIGGYALCLCQRLAGSGVEDLEIILDVVNGARCAVDGDRGHAVELDKSGGKDDWVRTTQAAGTAGKAFPNYGADLRTPVAEVFAMPHDVGVGGVGVVFADRQGVGDNDVNPGKFPAAGLYRIGGSRILYTPIATTSGEGEG